MHPVNMYFRCPSCRQIVHDPSGGMADPDHAASCCGATGEKRLPWPYPAITSLLTMQPPQELSLAEQRGFSAATLTLGLELLLESVVTDAAAARGIPVPAWMNAGSLNERLSAFETVAGKSLDHGAGETFVASWRALTEARTRLVHGDPATRHQHSIDDAALIATMQERSLPVFSSILNALIRDARSASPRKRPLTILVVDDDEAVLPWLGGILETHGYSVTSVMSGEEAVDTYRRLKPDCVFLDVMLPGMDGLSTLRALKELDPAAQIYFMTGIDGVSFKAQARTLGAVGHLVKPVNIEEVERICAELEKRL